MVRIAAGTTAVLALLLMPPAVNAQTPVQVPVRVVAENGNPISGALIRAVDASGDTIAGQITNRDGRVALWLPRAGRYTLLVQHVRYQEWNSDPIDITAATGQLEYRIPERAIAIDAVDALAERRCDTPPEEARAVVRTYELMRVALGRVLSAERGRVFRLREVYQRPWAARVDGRRRWNDTTYTETERPAATYSAPMLQEYGWASGRVGSNDRPVYSVPTADVVTSETFRATHCFRVAQHGDSGWVGLRFEPTPGTDLIDVRGTIWLDTLGNRPVRTEFRYTDLTEMMNRTERPVLRQELERVASRHIERSRNKAAAAYRLGNIPLEIPWVHEQGYGGFVEYRADGEGFITHRWEVAWPQLDLTVYFGSSIRATASTRTYRLLAEVLESRPATDETAPHDR